MALQLSLQENVQRLVMNENEKVAGVEAGSPENPNPNQNDFETSVGNEQTLNRHNAAELQTLFWMLIILTKQMDRVLF